MKQCFFILVLLFAWELTGCGGFVPAPVPIPYAVPGFTPDSLMQIATAIVRIDENGEPSLLNDNDHSSLGISSVENHKGLLRINYQNQAAKLYWFSTDGDECLSRYTAMGASGRLFAIDIQFRVTVHRTIGTRLVFDGTQWQPHDYPRSNSYTITANTPQKIALSHPKAEYGMNVTPCSSVLVWADGQEKYYESKIFIGVPPVAGDCIRFERDLDLGNPGSVFVPLQNVVGGYHCNIQVAIFYRE